jgi:type I restriction enzyme S subunit
MEKNLSNNWQIKKLKKIGVFSKGKNISKNDILEKGLSCVRYGEIYTTHNFIIKKCNSFISQETAKKSIKLNNGDILFACTGETAEEIGKCVAFVDNYEVYAGGDIMILKPYKDNSIFVSYYLNTIGRKQINILGQGNSIVHIHKSQLENLKISVPTLPEQNKIALVLSTQDEVIEKLEELIKLKEKQKKGLMQKLLTGKIRIKGFKEKWKEIKLGNICYITTGKLDANAMIKNGKYSFFTCAKEVYKINEYAFDTEALLISGNGNVGYIHYCKGKFNAYQRTYVLDKFSENIFFINYILYQFLSSRIKTEKRFGNIPYIAMATLTEMKLIIPTNLKEQSSISSILSTADKEITLLKQKLDLFKQQKKWLMQQLLTGKKRLA